MKNILLIEPDYKNKYPPLGLMKISTYHKRKGHKVIFYKGYSDELRRKEWDRIYISTLFTFYWKKTISTINFYSRSVKKAEDIYVGGVMATLLKEKIESIFDVTVVEGLLDEKGKLGYSDDDLIDCLLPDYSIIDPASNPMLDYYYPASNSYIAYATRGCIRKCKFCAVPTIEPIFTNSISIAKQVEAIKRKFGEKQNLLLLDNNILASKEFPRIIDEIKFVGFAKGAKYKIIKNGKKICYKRSVDFNQGIDARLLTEEKMKLISEIAIDPIRIAFDDIKFKKVYIDKVRMAAEFGIHRLSNYILYNYNDTPEDFYERLRINVGLNEEFERKGLKSYIWSFPMKYSPITGDECYGRRYIGRNWNKKYLRGVNCILLATHGVVGSGKDFFEEAFGKNVQEFIDILTLPEDYIIYRHKHYKDGKIIKLKTMIEKLNVEKKDLLMKIILSSELGQIDLKTFGTQTRDILKIYKHNT